MPPGSAEPDGGEHPLEHGHERLVDVAPIHPGPGDHGGPADVDDRQAQEEFRLGSVAVLGLPVGVAFGAAEGTVEEPVGVALVDVPGQVQQRARAVQGDGSGYPAEGDAAVKVAGWPATRWPGGAR
jgi:hypothetical protein